MHCYVCGTCGISENVCLGLYIQHGGECSDRDDSECDVDLVQFREIQEVRSALGNASRSGGRIYIICDEPRVARLCATVGVLRCAQPMASHNGGSNDDLVQVSSNCHILCPLVLT